MPAEFDVDALIAEAAAKGSPRATVGSSSIRREGTLYPGIAICIDSVGPEHCVFVRLREEAGASVFRIEGKLTVSKCAAGGWIAHRDGSEAVSYWMPSGPRERRVSDQGHILEEGEGTLEAASLSAERFVLKTSAPRGRVADLVFWQLPARTAAELTPFSPLEEQRYFLWGSHTRYQRPADLYAHLIFGHVYENRYAWPMYRKICSENDAHALYSVLRGLAVATGKRIYRLLMKQLLLSVLSRQGEDGGWRHGEWSERMESHFRLHVSGMHMLMDALADHNDSTVRTAALRAADFVAGRRDRLAAGDWFLHDELECSPQLMDEGPFRWRASQVLGKSPSNTLVLNTQLDSMVALQRLAALTGDSRFGEALGAAAKATQAVLCLRTAELFYRALFWTIGLTLLPTVKARQLPLPLRAIKRLTWKYVTPRFAAIKTRFPRLVMPGGYIDRALSVGAVSDTYLSINLMDLARYVRRFEAAYAWPLIDGAITYANDKGLLQRWSETPSKIYALGFWAEAMYHLCTLKPDRRYRAQLATTMLALEHHGLGQPPSLLGANPEAVAPADQERCPLLAGKRLRIANICRHGAGEFLVVNGSEAPAALTWLNDPPSGIRWYDGVSEVPVTAEKPVVPARSWLWGRRDA